MKKKRRTTLETAMRPELGDPDKGDGYWVNHAVTRRIRQECSLPHHGVALYFALSLTATDYQSRTVHITADHLSKLSGVKPGKIGEVLAELVTLGVIAVEYVTGYSGIDGLAKITLLGEIRLSTKRSDYER
jgi:hypothetical protein